jgi:hypothetical protein
MKLQQRVRKSGYELAASCYQLIMASLDDAEWFLKSVAENGGTFSELFFHFTWPAKPPSGWQFSIYPIVDWKIDTKEGTGEILYGGYKFPIWTLTQFDEAHVAKWTALFALFKKHNLRLYLRIHDWCSLKDPFKKRHYPFEGRNIQHDTGKYAGGMFWAWSADEDHPYGDPAKPKQITPYYVKGLQKLLAMLAEAEVDYRLVIMNEADYKADAGDTEEKKDGKVVLFHRWHIDTLYALGVPKNRCMISTSRGLEAMSKWGHAMEIHGINSPERLEDAVKNYPKLTMNRRIFPNGDGPDPNAKGRQGDAKDKREPSVAQAAEMATLIRRYKMKRYAYFVRPCDTLWIPKMRANTSVNYFDALKAMAEGVVK